MKNMTKRQLKNERNLHKLFATHLPTVPLPPDFAEHLVKSVLEEVASHTHGCSTAAEHRLVQPQKPILRRPQRLRRPPQVLVLALVCACVSLFLLASGCATQRPTTATAAAIEVQAAPTVPLLIQPPRLPSIRRSSVVALPPVEEAVGVPLARLPALTVSTTLTVPAMSQSVALSRSLGAQMAQMPVAVAQPEEPTEVATEPASTVTSLPNQPPTALPPDFAPSVTATSAELSITSGTPTLNPFIPQPNLFLPTATPLPPPLTPTPTVQSTYTPVLQPLPTATPIP